MPTSSKTDPLRAKAEPISDGSSASGITYLRRGKKLLSNTSSSQKRRVRICERNNFAGTKVSEEGRGEGAQGTGREIPLHPVVKTIVRQIVHLQPLEVNGGPDTPLQPVEDPMPERRGEERRGEERRGEERRGEERCHHTTNTNLL
ncbi:protein pxr1-like [Limosa lapponica baueri]|uniref:Protein pxr1-like n=1 Tax=Limosa lapponica baueri TaxID=1758121 RepID=A0A2I0UJR8_LIMLA|nr:protein pxr1-like [Limosa lapponica baueri]